jgi:hypothetical protein
MPDKPKPSVARNSLIMLTVQIIIKLLGFFLPSMPPAFSVSKYSVNTVLP